jgi:hypothetical protein
MAKAQGRCRQRLGQQQRSLADPGCATVTASRILVIRAAWHVTSDDMRLVNDVIVGSAMHLAMQLRSADLNSREGRSFEALPRPTDILAPSYLNGKLRAEDLYSPVVCEARVAYGRCLRHVAYGNVSHRRHRKLTRISACDNLRRLIALQ